MMLFDAHLLQVDTITTHTERRPGKIQNLVFSSGGEALYIADSAGSSVSMVRRYDGETIARWQLPPGRVPQELTLLPSARILILVHYSDTDSAGAGDISILSARDLSESTRLRICDGRPDGVAVMRSGERAFVRCTGHQALMVVVDLELRRVVTSVSLGPAHRADSAQSSSGCGPGGIALSRTEALLLLPCSQSGYLFYVDRLTQEPFDSVFVGVGIDRIAISPHRPHALLSSVAPPTISFVNLRTRSVDARIPLSATPKSLAISGDGHSAVVSTRDEAAGTLMLLNMDARTVVTTVRVAGAGAVSMWPGRWSPVLTW